MHVERNREVHTEKFTHVASIMIKKILSLFICSESLRLEEITDTTVDISTSLEPEAFLMVLSLSKGRESSPSDVNHETQIIQEHGTSSSREDEDSDTTCISL